MSEPVSGIVRLLREMRPRLNDGVYAYCELPHGTALPSDAVAWFSETEGESAILPAASARAAGLAVAFEAAWITLGVHSALDATGLTAAVSMTLTEDSIPCNVVAALRHDHVFVPVAQAEAAMRALRRLSAQAGGPPLE